MLLSLLMLLLLLLLLLRITGWWLLQFSEPRLPC
jgi:hypothetical protein